ncbi:MAG TPA: hypothetical protein DEO65_04495 [Bacillus bacterium]|uniref:hypothetical protein n=1 Tax=Siminovitchia fordii TaxID=254759 RepID=UPI0003819294|nr:hypothetical protein [Siminovitchia fordii]HBZ09135.1 hypothetical protein [Bacillus sp. (in: firmicutes)]
MGYKLQKLFDDPNFAVGSIGCDTGLMINPQNDVVDYMIIEYPGRFEVYLNLFDYEDPSIPNVLVKGKSKSLEVAKSIAVRKLNKEAYGI